MRARIDRLSRILRMRRRLQETAEARLVALTRAARDLDDRKQALVELSSGHAAGQALAASALRRLGQVTIERRMTEEQIAQERARLTALRRGIASVERMSVRLSRALDESDARALLEDVSLQIATTGSGKQSTR